MPTAILFKTSEDGSASPTERLVWLDGKVGIGSADPNSVLDIVAADPVLTLRDTSASVTNANATLRLAESNGNGVIENYWAADNMLAILDLESNKI